MDLTPRRLNLSYVLHEPSTSGTVQLFAARSRAEERRVRRAAARLAALPDPALRERIVLLSEATPVGSALTSPAPVATIHLGPWWLLPRLLSLVAPDGAPRPIHLLDQPAAPAARDATFFRAAARLHVPDAAAPAGYPSWFATVALRPGGTSLLLRLEPVPGLDTPLPEREAALLAAAERAIRAHVEQWCCPGPLWNGPVETALLEFAPG